MLTKIFEKYYKVLNNITYCITFISNKILNVCKIQLVAGLPYTCKTDADKSEILRSSPAKISQNQN